MKLIIAGSRDYSNYPLMKTVLDTSINKSNLSSIEIISGKAKGADSLGEKYARENNINLKIFPANWNKYGKRAGYLRNKEMSEYATHCICFWDKKSKGTKHMIQLAITKKLFLRVVIDDSISKPYILKSFDNL